MACLENIERHACQNRTKAAFLSRDQSAVERFQLGLLLMQRAVDPRRIAKVLPKFPSEMALVAESVVKRNLGDRVMGIAQVRCSARDAQTT
jgi:hypothetical protein